MNSYCTTFTGGKCKYTGRHVPRSWCDNVCKGKAAGMPSVARMAYNYTKDTARWAASGFVKADLQTQKKRLAICRANKCRWYVNRKGIDRCRHGCCGCYLERKVVRKSSKCPQGYW